MFDSDQRLDRRTVLKGLGGVGTAAAIGGVGMAAMSGGAAAQASMKLDVTGTEYTGDQGKVDWYGVDLVKWLEWDGYDVPVRAIDITHEITLENDTIDGNTDWFTVYDGRTDPLPSWSGDGNSNGWGGDGEYVYSHGGDKADYLKGNVRMDVSWALISDGSHPNDYDSVQNTVDWTDYLSVPEDGATKKRVLRWKTEITYLTDAYDTGGLAPVKEVDGEPTVTGMERVGITVTNEPGNTEGDGSGSSTIQ